VLGGLSVWRNHPVAGGILAGVGAALLLVGFFSPVLSQRFETLWMKLALFLGYVNSRIILTVLFYLVFAPMGILTRLFGYDPLRRKRTPAETYWIPRKFARQTKEMFERPA
jgi:hypothetical protein